MSTSRRARSRALSVAPLCGFVLVSTAAFSANAQLFTDDSLRYFSDSPAATKPAHPEQPAKEVPEEDFEDPNSDAFWAEGNYMPPALVRRAAISPTPENIAKYLRWQRKKLTLLAALENEVHKQVGAPDGAPQMSLGAPASALGALAGAPVSGASSLPGAPSSEIEAPEAVRPSLPLPGLRFAWFYRATCPHCQKDLATVEALRTRGVDVLPVQLDWKEHEPLLANSIPYTDELAQKQPVPAVPLWVGSLEGRSFSASGEQTPDSLLAMARSAAQADAPRQRKKYPVLTPVEPQGD